MARATRKSPDRRAAVLQFLSATEIDDSIVSGLLRIEGARAVLAGVAKGEIGASGYQVGNAIHVLGRLRESDAIPHLLSVLEKADAPQRLRALAALARIGPDERAVAALKTVARDRKAEPAEIAFALRALERGADRSLADEFAKQPPRHGTDSGVSESLARLVATARRRPVGRATGKPA
ncbi:MAG: HEAT repeat domain-containing protein [Alphaproteobacteria bacterium]